MYGVGGGSGRFMFNRFGDEVDYQSSIRLQIESQTKSEIRDLVKSGLSEMKKMMRTPNDDSSHVALNNRLGKIESTMNIKDNFIGFKSKRLVSVSNAIDKHDVVNKYQLDTVKSTVDRLTKTFDVSNPEVVNLNGHRRIGKVSRSKDLYDVIVRKELNELNEKLVIFQTNLNTILGNIHDDIINLKRAQNGNDISDKDAASENPGQRMPNDIPSRAPYPPQ